MTNQRTVTALAGGFLAFTLSILPVTIANAGCQMVSGGVVPQCPEGTAEAQRTTHSTGLGQRGYTLMCCTVDAPGGGQSSPRPVKSMKKVKCSNPNATYNGQTGRCELPLKQMGKDSPTGKAALKRACDLKNWVWNERTGRCKKPTQAKADCEARGSNYRYDLDTGGCVGGMSKGKRKSEARADCEARGRKFRFDFDTGRCIKRVDMSDEREFDDEDFQPQKKKKKRKIDLDIDIF